MSCVLRDFAAFVVLLHFQVVCAGENGTEPHPVSCGRGVAIAPECLSMTSPSFAPLRERGDAAVVSRYLETCKTHQVVPSADVLAQLQLGSGSLKIWKGQKFNDLDMRALVTALEDDDGTQLSLLRQLDLSGCSLGPSGMLMVAQLLRHPRCMLESLDVSYQSIGPAGAFSIVDALREYKRLRFLRMHTCDLGDEGAALIAELLENTSGYALQVVEAQNNYISFEWCSVLLQISGRRRVEVNLNGNRVFDEVMNAVTHGIGFLLAIVATVLLAVKAHRQPRHVKWATGLYCASLLVMYLCSTLFHALFATGHRTVYIFSIFDYSAIFLLIAGSYTPFLGVLFPTEMWARTLLAALWVSAILGVLTAAFYTGPGAVWLRVILYLVMGWAALSNIATIARTVGKWGTILLVGGGLMYTLGVPFFIRGQHTFDMPDHSIWHVFVVGGSGLHFWCVYSYVLGDDRCQKGESGEELSSESDIDRTHEYVTLQSGSV